MMDHIEKAIKKLDIQNDKELTRIAQSIMEESWRDPRRVVNILHYANKIESKKAALILLSIDELAMTPLLDTIEKKSTEKYVWDMDTVVSIQLRKRSQILKILDDMLLDMRYVDEPEEPIEIEDTAPSRRVCDEAYIIARRLFAYEENEEDLSANIELFLDMSDEDRDIEIDRFKKTRKWTSLLEKAFDEDIEEDI